MPGLLLTALLFGWCTGANAAALGAGAAIYVGESRHLEASRAALAQATGREVPDGVLIPMDRYPGTAAMRFLRMGEEVPTVPCPQPGVAETSYQQAVAALNAKIVAEESSKLGLAAEAMRVQDQQACLTSSVETADLVQPAFERAIILYEAGRKDGGREAFAHVISMETDEGRLKKKANLKENHPGLEEDWQEEVDAHLAQPTVQLWVETPPEVKVRLDGHTPIEGGRPFNLRPGRHVLQIRDAEQGSVTTLVWEQPRAAAKSPLLLWYPGAWRATWDDYELQAMISRLLAQLPEDELPEFVVAHAHEAWTRTWDRRSAMLLPLEPHTESWRVPVRWCGVGLMLGGASYMGVYAQNEAVLRAVLVKWYDGFDNLNGTHEDLAVRLKHIDLWTGVGLMGAGALLFTGSLFAGERRDGAASAALAGLHLAPRVGLGAESSLGLQLTGAW